MIITSFNGKAERRLTAGQTAKNAGVVELVDTSGLSPDGRLPVQVRVLSPAPYAPLVQSVSTSG